MLVATKVHMILRSFVVLAWMHDKREHYNMWHYGITPSHDCTYDDTHNNYDDDNVMHASVWLIIASLKVSWKSPPYILMPYIKVGSTKALNRWELGSQHVTPRRAWRCLWCLTSNCVFWQLNISYWLTLKNFPWNTRLQAYYGLSTTHPPYPLLDG